MSHSHTSAQARSKDLALAAPDLMRPPQEASTTALGMAVMVNQANASVH